MFSRSTKEHASYGLLDLLVAEDARRDGVEDLLSDLRVLAHSLEGFLLVIAVLKVRPCFQLLDSSCQDITLGKVVSLHVVHKHYACYFDPVARHTSGYVVTVNY